MKYIYICFISLFFTSLYGQEDSIKVDKKKNPIHFSIGTDLAMPAMGLFTDRMGYSVLVNFQFKKLWFIQAQLGWEKNKYEDIGWDDDIKGNYIKIGANYIISKDKENHNNMFYAGGKFAYSDFTQTLNSVPIRAIGQTTQYVNLGEDKAKAYWLEIPLGARVAFLKDILYLEAIFSTNILLHSDSDLGVEPPIMPNFGKDKSGLNFNIFWGITYCIK